MKPIEFHHLATLILIAAKAFGFLAFDWWLVLLPWYGVVIARAIWTFLIGVLQDYYGRGEDGR